MKLLSNTQFLLVALALLLVACQPLDVTTTPDNFTVEGVFTPVMGPVNVTNTTANLTATDEQTSLPTTTVKEGQTVRLNRNFAQDPDGDTIKFTFPEPFNAQGVWQTKIGDAGSHIIPITVSDGDFSTVYRVRVIVEAVNSPPVIANLQDITVHEGDTITLDPKVTDRENDRTTISYSGFMTKASYTTKYTDAGIYSTTVTASDGKDSSVKEIKITILNTNRKPVIAAIDDMTAVVGQEIRLSPQVSDADEDDTTITYSSLFNRNGTFTPTSSNVGQHTITVTASDGTEQTAESFKLTVREQNRAPVITAPSPQTAREGSTFTLNVQTSDADGDNVLVTYSGYMQAGSRYIDYDQAGNYTVMIRASDGKLSTTKNVTIIVENVNRPPVFTGDIFG